MMVRFAIPLVALAALAACEQPRGIGFGPESYGANIPEGAEVTVFELPGIRPIPAYVSAGVSGPEGAVAYGGAGLAQPEANLDLNIDGRQYLLRQVAVGGTIYVVVQGGPAATSIPSEILTRTGCLLTGLPVTVRGVTSAPAATVYALDCA